MEKMGSPDVPGREPTSEEITDYFSKLGLRFRKELAILKSPEFRVAGKIANSEGWFVGQRGLFEAVVALKVADLMGLSSEERRLLAQAAFLGKVNKRNTVEAERNAAFDVSTLLNEKGDEILEQKGVDPRVVQIMEGSSGLDYSRNVTQGKKQPTTEGERQIFALQRVLNFVHWSVETKVEKDTPTPAHNIINWRDRLAEVRTRYPVLDEQKENIGGEELSQFDMEERTTSQNEKIVKDAILRLNPEHDFEQSMELSSYLLRKIKKDIVEHRDVHF